MVWERKKWFGLKQGLVFCFFILTLGFICFTNESFAQTFDITIDATKIQGTFAIGRSTGWLNTVNTQTINLSPGIYSFIQKSGSFDFTVNSSGTVDFTETVSKFVAGRGTTALTVNGFPIDIDATGLTGKFGLFEDTDKFNTSTTQPVNLIPGNYSLFQGAASFDFKVTPDGKVEFATVLNNYVEGSETTKLKVNGFPINIDATGLVGHFGLFEITDGLTTKRIQDVKLIPGRYSLFQGSAALIFEVTPDGSVKLEPALDSYISGSGTATLRVKGLPTIKDASKRLSNALPPSGKEFAGTHFGVGLTMTHNSQQHIEDRVEEAQIINGTVRITKERNQVLRLMLETHYFFIPEHSFIYLADAGTWGFGPFVGVQTGSDEVIDALGGGIMLGFKRATADSRSFNMGIGYVIDNNVRVLGGGFKANEPPPNGETEVRFKEKTQGGIILIASFSF